MDAAFMLLLPLLLLAATLCQVAASLRSQLRASGSGRLPLSMEMAPFKAPRRQNAEGNLFVDQSCIDCDVCRWMAPRTYTRVGMGAAVTTQPLSEADRVQAYAAMVTCPVGAIRLKTSDPLVNVALEAFPAPLDPANIPRVMHLGFSSADSFGATAYLVKREEGNLMIDIPRYNSKLAQAIEAEGGVHTLIVTHRDDLIADHERWKKKFPTMKRVIHRTDAVAEAKDFEVKLEGSGVWKPSPDYHIIHTPGHTAGSICILLLADATGGDGVLFSGDHLAYSGSKQRLEGFKRYCQGNTDLQSEYIRYLAESADVGDFSWLLPGHGRMTRFASQAERRAAILQAADEYDKEDAADGAFGIGYF